MNDQPLPASALDYPLDEACIATHPAHPRDGAKMLVLHRGEDRVEHRLVRDLCEYLHPRGALVVNETRVEAMRFVGRCERDGRGCEGLFVEAAADGLWRVLVKGARRLRAGDALLLEPPPGNAAAAEVRVHLQAREGMHWLVRPGQGMSAAEAWSSAGWTPLPPYILHARRERGERDDAASADADRREYQTVYARGGDLPSCAAPTAGLHFTPQLLQQVAALGVGVIRMELQVGPGTFRPVEADHLGDHPMHAERCRLSAAALAALAECDRAASLIVGTTSVRLLESLPDPLPADAIDRARTLVAAGRGAEVVLEFDTQLLVAPGFDFRWTDRLLTNFHLPRSTLLALVGALAGLDRLKSLYALAQREGYRFYSFGDAMLLLP